MDSELSKQEVMDRLKQTDPQLKFSIKGSKSHSHQSSPAFKTYKLVYREMPSKISAYLRRLSLSQRHS